jgi:hypothetical protein
MRPYTDSQRSALDVMEQARATTHKFVVVVPLEGLACRLRVVVNAMCLVRAAPLPAPSPPTSASARRSRATNFSSMASPCSVSFRRLIWFRLAEAVCVRVTRGLGQQQLH